MNVSRNRGTFPRSARLLTGRQFKQVFSNPEKVFQAGFLALMHSNNEGQSRLGLAVSKKNLPRAVDRNRIKRMVRETFRQHMDPEKAVDIVVLTRNPIVNMDNTHLLKQLRFIWHQANKRNW